MIALTVALSGSAAVATAAPMWTIQSVPPHLGATQSILRAVSCVSANACTAVGQNFNGSIWGASGEEWNGTAWSAASVIPAGEKNGDLYGVSCVSPSECIAVGAYGTGGKPATLAEVQRGTSWTTQATTNPPEKYPEGDYLLADSCRTLSNCTAVGENAEIEYEKCYLGFCHVGWGGLSELWKGGSSWTTWGENMRRGGGTYRGVSCFSETACMLVGDYSKSEEVFPWAETLSGEYLTTVVPSGAVESVLEGVSCVSGSACWADGYYKVYGSSVDHPLVEHWGAGAWTLQTITPPSGAIETVLQGVSCVAENACMIVGYYVNSSGKRVPLAERWNGSTWLGQEVPVPAGATSSELLGVSCTAATTCTAVGGYINASGYNSLVEKLADWSVQPTVNGTGTPDKLFGISCALKTACTAVGVNGSGPFNENSNGALWSLKEAVSPSGATSAELLGTSCSASTECTAVGHYTNSAGAILSLAETWSGGGSWSLKTSVNPTGATATGLESVSCTSSSACTAVGYYNNSSGTKVTLAERWNGSEWKLQTTPNPVGATSSTLLSVSCASATACTAAGDYYTSAGARETLAESWNGSEWKLQTTPNPVGATRNILLGVACSSASACTAVGGDFPEVGPQATLIEHWNGTSWSIEPSSNPTGSQASILHGVSCPAATACTAVGDYVNAGINEPLAETWNGAAWTVQWTPPGAEGATFGALWSVSCITSTECTAGGYYTNKSGTTYTLAENYSE